MRTITVTFSDGSGHVYNGVPDEATPEQVAAKVKADFPGKTISNLDGGRAQAPVAPADEPNIRGRGTPEAPRAATPADIPGNTAGYAVPAKQFDAGIVPLAGMAGNVVGGTLGAAGGAPTGPGAIATSVAGATMGGALARYSAALYEANRQNMTPQETQAFINEHAGVSSVALDAAGNLLFMLGGKVIFTVAKNTEVGRATIKALGNMVNDLRVQGAAAVGAKQAPKPIDWTLTPGANAPDANIVPSQEPVLGARAGAEATTQAELRGAAVQGARDLTDAGVSPTTGQLTGQAPAAEKLWKMGDPEGATAHADAMDAVIQKKLDDFIDTKAGFQSGKTPGHTYAQAVEGLEQSVKAFNDPVYAALDSAGGKVDVRGLKAAAQARLDGPKAKLAPGEESFLKTIVSLGDDISFADMQGIRSNVLRMARDAEKPGSSLSPTAGVYKDWSRRTTERLLTALDDAAGNAERQAAMFGSGDAAAQAELAAARRAGEGARATPVQAERVPGNQDELFPQAQGELLATGDVAAADQAAATANRARTAGIAQADAAAAGAEGRIAAGVGEQKSMLAPAPTVDPRLPTDLRAAATRLREMHETVYGATGTKALRAAEMRGPEHLAKTIYADGNLTAIEELGALAQLAAKMDKYGATDAGKKALLERMEKLRQRGGNVDLPGMNGNTILETVQEAHKGIVAEYLEQALKGPDALRALSETMKDAAKRRTFLAMLPDKADRLMVERLVQMADMAQRARGSSGSNMGMQQMVRAGTAIGLGVGGATTGYIPLMVAGATMYFGPKVLAHMLTKPSYKILAGKASEEWLRAAGGSAATASYAATKQLIEQLKAHGYDVTKPGE